MCHQILKMVACVRGQSDSPLVGKQLGDVGQEWGTPSDNSFPPTGGRFGFDAKPLVRRTGGPHLRKLAIYVHLRRSDTPPQVGGNWVDLPGAVTADVRIPTQTDSSGGW